MKERDRTWVGSLPITSPRRTLEDCTATHFSPELLEQAFEQAARRGLVSRAGAFTLTVNGSSFVSASVVSFGGATVTTTFVSKAQLSAAIPAASIATPATST